MSLGMIGCYTPTDCSPNFLEKESFYIKLDAVLRNTKRKCCTQIAMEDITYRLGQVALVNHMNVAGRLTDSMETTENGMRLLRFC